METKHRFITAVSMPCTQEHFERDLKGPLEEMGYMQKLGVSHNTGILSTRHGGYAYVEEGTPDSIHSTRIETYSHEHFIAIASMTDKPEGIPGEWWMSQGDPEPQFIEGKIYKSVGGDDKMPSFNDEQNIINGYVSWEKHNKRFRKATVEEINRHFDGKPHIETVIEALRNSPNKLKPTEFVPMDIQLYRIRDEVKPYFAYSIFGGNRKLTKQQWFDENVGPVALESVQESLQLYKMTGLAKDLWSDDNHMHDREEPKEFWVSFMRFTGGYDLLLVKIVQKEEPKGETDLSYDRGTEPMGKL